MDGLFDQDEELKRQAYMSGADPNAMMAATKPTFEDYGIDPITKQAIPTPASTPAATPPVQVEPGTDLSLKVGATPSVRDGVTQPDFSRPNQLSTSKEVETKVIEEGYKPSEQVIRAKENAFMAQQKALKAQADAQKAALEEESKARDLMASEKLVEAERVQEQRNEYKNNLANEMNRYDTAYKELADANKIEVNPRRYIDNMSTASKVMVGIGLLLSGFGGADSVMKSMSILNKAVDDDIAAQKLAREGKVEAAKTGIASIDKKINQVRDSLKDDIAFDELQRDLRYSAIESQLEAAKAKAKTPEVEAKLQEGIAAIQERRAESQMKLEQMAMDKVKKQIVTTRESQVVAPGKAVAASLTPAEKKADEEYGKKWSEFMAEGGKAGAEFRLNKLEKLKDRFQETPFPPRVSGLLPEKAQKVMSPDVQSLKNEVQSVVQESLRPILGGQFAASEAQQVLDRAFDPLMDKKENFRRLENEIQKIRAKVEAETAAAEYYGEKGTLKGFTGPRAETKEKQTKAEAPHGNKVKQGGKTYVWNGSEYVEE